MLRQQIDQCKGVVQLIGQCYGAEPPTPDEEYGRLVILNTRLCMRKQGKKVWYLSGRGFPIDPHEPEPRIAPVAGFLSKHPKVDTIFSSLATREAWKRGSQFGTT